MNKKQSFGKYHDRVRLNVYILASQDRELDRLCKISGQTKTDAIIDAVGVWTNAFREALRKSAEVK